ncbi:MAG: hypothetical protein K2H53_05130 [Clostridia bacterium]|nr:hypothetical protein [Clostridia bacterium]
MNKTCNNVKTVVSEIQRLLGNLYELSDTLKIRNLTNLGFIKAEDKACLDKLLDLCESLQTKSDVLSDLQRLLDSIPLISNILNDDELMNLEFIRSFGADMFIGLADETCIDKLLDWFKIIELKCSVFFTYSTLVDHDHLGGSSRCFSKHKRAERRVLEVKARTRAIQLGSAAVYSKDGTLARGEGIAYKKCIESMHKAIKTPWSKSKFENAAKILERTRHLIRLAEVYEDYTLLYRGRYFKDDKVLVSKEEDSEEVEESTEQFEVEHKKSKPKLYDTKSLFEKQIVQEDDDPKSIRRNMHSANNSGRCKKRLTVDCELTSTDVYTYFKTYIPIPYIDYLPHSYGYL